MHSISTAAQTRAAVTTSSRPEAALVSCELKVLRPSDAQASSACQELCEKVPLDTLGCYNRKYAVLDHSMLKNAHHFLAFDPKRTGYDYARLVVLQGAEGLMGYCLVHVSHRNRNRLDTQVDLYLDEVWIEPAHRGQGLARQLVQGFVSVAEEALDRMGAFRKVRVLAHAVSPSGAAFTRQAQQALSAHLDEIVELAMNRCADLHRAPWA